MTATLPTRSAISLLGAALALVLSGTGPVAAQDANDQLIQDLRFRNIGNANQKGRVSAIDALDDDWTYVVVGTASGGVFKSVNGGTTWTPIFDNYGAASIGDVTIDPSNPDIIWVGTGEECGRNTAAWGNGVYKSTDGGRTFQNMGLRDVFTIGSVVVDPRNSDIVYVTALGNIWDTNNPGERGLFRTQDGGRTWSKLTNGLPDDGRTGALYAVMDPRDSNTLYATFWERHRTPWVLESGGPNGGIFKTTDGGQSWRKLTEGLPEGPSGKIGIDIARGNPDVLMVHYEHGFQPAEDDPAYTDMNQLGSGLYRTEDAGESWEYVNRYWSRPFYYNHVFISPIDDEVTFHPNQQLQFSTDGGRTLQRYEDSGGGHCFHALWADPHNADRFWVASDGGVTLTQDGGESWVAFKNLNATQYYRVDVDMRDPYYVCGGLQDAGSSCGPSMTRSNGIYLSEWYNLEGGDGTHVLIDPSDWRTVYTTRDPRGAGPETIRSDVVLRTSKDIRPNKGVNILNYAEYITPAIEQAQLDKGWGPAPLPGESFNYRGAGMGAFRWNWESPMQLSPFDPSTIYYGANHLFKSTNRGDEWRIISPDLTKNDPVKTRKESGGLSPDAYPGGGAEYYGTIVTLAESPVVPDQLWVGTDDGNVQLSTNGGESWTNVAPNVPGLPRNDLYVSRVVPSRFDGATAFLTYDGHELGLFRPWVFKTTDLGRSWTDISSNLPAEEPVYGLEQDVVNRDLLFVGTEFGVYYTVDGGASWAELDGGLPTVAVHDVVVHPRDHDLILATHGRGIWIMDDISGLQQLTPEIRASTGHLFENPPATEWLAVEPMDDGGAYAFVGENPTRNGVINYWLGSAARGQVQFEISSPSGEVVRRCSVAARPGIGKLEWDLTASSAPGPCVAAGGGGRGEFGGAVRTSPVPPGTYRVAMTVNGTRSLGTLTVRTDPMLRGG